LEEEGNLTAYSTLVVEGPTASGLNIMTGFPSVAEHLGGQSFSSMPIPASAADHGAPIFQSMVASKKAPASLI